MEHDPVDELWAKTDRDTMAYHPLYCHLVDVGLVAHAILASDDAGHLLRVFARLFGVSEDETRRVAPFLVSTHDLGKASPSFEQKAREQWTRLVASGWPSEVPPHPHSFRHDRELSEVFADLLRSKNIFAVEGTDRRGRQFYRAVALGLGGHHGRFYGDALAKDYPEIAVSRGRQDGWTTAWRNAREVLIARLMRLFGVSDEPISCRPSNLSALTMLLCGFTILCDWIGSDQERFRPYSGDIDAYPGLARRIAQRALQDRRLLEFLPVPCEEPTFHSLFPKINSPRPLQRALDPAELSELPGQLLAIVEAPTGEGKTEAALLLASRLSYRSGQRGFYFALPTMATSNQMGERVERFLLDQLTEGERAHLLLVHGLAGLSEQLARLLAANQHDGLAPEDRIVADSWLLPRKRSLLSPYGTGTVDQALVCALNVRHGALRMLGLAAKVVVIDEVHAYDLYMSTILDRLLAWLRVIGASVILLSATLPSRRRRELIAAFCGRDESETNSLADAAYPLITLADSEPNQPIRKISAIPVREQQPVQIVRWADGETERRANAGRILGEVAEGGCAAWICNTVGEAQAAYGCLKELADKLSAVERTEVYLFHARFPLGRRVQIESRILDAFGPEPAPRPQRAVLVGTQVLEQSLDLDFDFMVSQLAPVDLLLQRLGRLQRHQRKNRAGRFVGARRFVLLEPPARPEGGRSFGHYDQVYEPWLLYKTLAALANREVVSTPTDVRPLIEAVYDDVAPSAEELARLGVTSEAIDQAKQERDRRREILAQEARIRLVNPPSEGGSFLANQSILSEDEEDEAAEGDLVAVRTRYARPSVRVILLDATDPLFITLDADKASSLDVRAIQCLLLKSVTLQHGKLVGYLRDGDRAANRKAGDPLRLDDVRGLAGYVALPLSPEHVWRDSDGQIYLRVDDDLGILFKEE